MTNNVNGSDEMKFHDVSLIGLVRFLLRKSYILVVSGTFVAVLMILLVKRCKSGMTDAPINPEIITEISSEDEATEISAMLSADAVEEMNICMDRVARMQELKKYMNEAALMQVDPYNCKKLTVVYEVYSDVAANAQNVYTQYVTLTTTEDEFRNTISEALGDTDDNYHISDLITTDVIGVTKDGITIYRTSFSIILLPEWDETAVLNAIRIAVESYSLPSPIEGVEVSFLTSSSIVKSFADIKALQTSVVNQYNNDTTALRSALLALDRPSALMFNYKLKQIGLENDYNVAIADPKPDALREADDAKGIKGKIADISYPKAVILGGIVGVFMMVVIMTLLLMIRGKAGRIMGLSVMSDRPLYGIIKPNKLKDDEKKSGLLETAENMKFCLSRAEVKAVDLVCIGEAGKAVEETVNQLCSKYKELSGADAKVSLVSAKNPDCFKVLSGLSDSAIFCVVFEKNSLKEIYDYERMLTNGKVSVLGCIGLE